MTKCIYAIIVAGGTGARFGSAIAKQYMPFQGKTVLWHAVKPFTAISQIKGIIVVCHPSAMDQCTAALSDFKNILYVEGGATRQASVLNGLRVLVAEETTHVLIHDAARPFVREDTINHVIQSLEMHVGVTPILPVTDTIKKLKDSYISDTISRETLGRAQTPQGFHFETLLTQHTKYAESSQLFTDDASLLEADKIPVYCIDGDEMNIKITTLKDLPPQDYRTATGIDVHAIGQGTGCFLFGVFVPCSFGLIGHSDADVGLHAITDALLGAICLGDIGQHFSCNNEQWKNADSSIFLKFAVDKIAERGGRIIHVDATLIGEHPKLSAYRDIMRARLSELLSLNMDRISLKATTTEKLGFCGREEGLAVLATATVCV